MLVEDGPTPAETIEGASDAAASSINGEETLEQREIRAALDPVRRFAKRYPEMNRAKFGEWVLSFHRDIRDRTLLMGVTLYCEQNEFDMLDDGRGEAFKLEDDSFRVIATHELLPSHYRPTDESEVEVARRAKALIDRFLGKQQPRAVTTDPGVPTQ